MSYALRIVRVTMTHEETFTDLAAFLTSLDQEGELRFELSHSLVIICPDCGKNIAFRGRCPKCAGNSWIPAGHNGGVIGLDRFGASAPGAIALDKLGINVAHVVEEAKKLVKK